MNYDNQSNVYGGNGGYSESGSFPNVAPGQPDPTPGITYQSSENINCYNSNSFYLILGLLLGILIFAVVSLLTSLFRFLFFKHKK